ncbi:hypothetical protein JF66_02350 [Cryobacterium sp. MLB-32]|uniref:lycopene cyclase family protein n=1 Tax=Cryobacterium sp. MLB-32 TaxID=1529318 RepID=UPI0004E76A3F|nr:lycopene cyclase family protein [Cryobacterium sp. MLB-32]KFF60762.1 hypothetical protein JF66_02350 [Cryobacterium sp. MLB-32]
MNHILDADVVILGAGCAGLSLAGRLAEAHTHLRIILVDPRAGYHDDRSWCFWRPEKHDLSDLVSARWSGWRFSDTAGTTALHRVPGLSYQYIRSIDFYNRAVEKIAAAPTIELRLGVRAGAISVAADGVRVETDQGPLLAGQVIDTRPQHRSAILYQSFVGVELHSTEPHGFNPSEVTLMGSMAADASGLRFVYALPLDDHRLILEWTRFGAAPIPRRQLVTELDGVLAAHSLGDAVPVRTEGGVLAMGLRPDDRPPLPGVVSAGNAGGALRAASGYGFLRIQRWAEACAGRLLAGAPAIGHPSEPWSRATLDRLFLQAVRRHPERTAEYFLALAQGVPAPSLLRFLSDGAHTLDYARIIGSLPKRPFIAEMTRRATYSPTPPAMVVPAPAQADTAQSIMVQANTEQADTDQADTEQSTTAALPLVGLR